jgi:hypothetical protein
MTEWSPQRWAPQSVGARAIARQARTAAAIASPVEPAVATPRPFARQRDDGHLVQIERRGGRSQPNAAGRQQSRWGGNAAVSAPGHGRASARAAPISGGAVSPKSTWRVSARPMRAGRRRVTRRQSARRRHSATGHELPTFSALRNSLLLNQTDNVQSFLPCIIPDASHSMLPCHLFRYGSLGGHGTAAQTTEQVQPAI